jgi:HAD superfamily hydrolase (TIGR01509 family)
MIRGIVFDMDGVLIDSEPVWAAVRQGYVREEKGIWHLDSQVRMMGLSTSEWARFMSGQLGVKRSPTVIAEEVVARIGQHYATNLPLLPHAASVVRQMAESYTVGLASSSPRVLIDMVLETAGLKDMFTATRSTEEEAYGKPSPDVYLTVTRMLALSPQECLAVEDSSGGLQSAARAGLKVIAVPQAAFPPSTAALELATRVLPDLSDLPPAVKELNQPRAY